MKFKILGLVALCTATAVAPMQSATAASKATDNVITLALADAQYHPEWAEHVPSDIKFYLAGQPVTVKQLMGPVKTSRKTNGSGKRAKGDACRWALMSGLIAMAEEARLQGGNAVVNIRSNFGDVETSSANSYKCGIGAVMVGVALKGDVAIVE